MLFQVPCTSSLFWSTECEQRFKEAFFFKRYNLDFCRKLRVFGLLVMHRVMGSGSCLNSEINLKRIAPNLFTSMNINYQVSDN